MPGGDKKWDITAERDLCLAIILGNAESEKVRHNWPRVHAFMGELGYDFTKDAISQHFTKAIMKDFKRRHGTNGSPAATPKKATSRATPRKRATKRKVESSDEELGESDEPVEKQEKQTKKFKREKKVKDEEDHERRARERSATLAGNDARFEDWLNSGPQ